MDKLNLPPLNALKAFEAAAKYQSISQAADELCVTHGAVSRQIKQLESFLTVSLFSKEGRGVKLTEAGEKLYQATHQAFSQLRQTCQQLQQQQADAPFVLSCPGSLLARWLIPRLEQLKQQLPDLQLQVVTHEGDDLAAEANPHISAYLVFSQAPWPENMQVIELVDETIGPVLSATSPLAQQLLNAQPDALINAPLLFTRSRPQAWPEWLAQQGLTVEQLSFAQGFAHLYYLLEAAVAGLGVAIAPELLVRDELQTGRLVAPWGFTQTTAKLALLLPSSFPHPAAADFAEWAKQQALATVSSLSKGTELKS